MDRLGPEQHDSLDGVPNPSESSALFGHEAPMAAVTRAYAGRKLPHALILTGPRGIGKATFAFHLAHYLLSNPGPEQAATTFSPRDTGASLFRQVAGGAHPSVLHLTRPLRDTGTGFKSVISVDEIRRIGRFLSMTSHDASYRVVIIDPADDMNRNAANALLKNLEEPPARTIFLLISHSLGALMPTVRSRCQILRFEPLSDAAMMSVLATFDIAVPPDGPTRQTMLAQAAGSPRSAVLVSEYGGGEIASTLAALVSAPRLGVGDAHKLAEAVAGRDQAIQFGLFNERALDLLSEAAIQAAGQGDARRADRLAETFEKSRVAISEADTYNLDRKQHALSMINRLHDAFRM